MRSALRGAAAAATMAALGLCVLPPLPSCGESFEAPCRVTARVVIDPAARGAIRVGPVAIAEGPNGEVVIVSFALSEEGDAGVGDAGVGDADPLDASGGATSDAGVGAFVAPYAHALVMTAFAERRVEHSFRPPSALRARRGSTGAVGASFTGDGMLFHWQEQTVATSADGVALASNAIVFQRVALDGTESPAIADPELACARCTVDRSFATAGGVTAAIITQLPAPTTKDQTRRTRLFAFAPNGTKLGSVSLDILASAADEGPQGSPPGRLGGGMLGGQASAPAEIPLRLTVQRGLFLVRIGRRAAFFEPPLTPRGPPVYELPTSETELDLDPRSGRIAIVYSAAATIAGDAAPPFPTGGHPDLFYEQRVPGSIHPTASRRVSASFTAIDVRKNGDRVGIVHTAGGEIFFSLVEENGHKLGGDHRVGEGAASSGRSSSDGAGTFDTAITRSLLATPEPGQYVQWLASGDVVREVITCDR